MMFIPKLLLAISFLFLLGINCISQSDSLNQTDSLGLKQGYWIFCGKDMPEKNFPVDGKVEEGTYLNDKKNGTWIIYHTDGHTPKVIGTFVNGRPKGPYSRYYENGQLAETGSFLNGHQDGLHKIYYQSGCLKYQTFFEEEVGANRMVYWYHDNCLLDTIDIGSIDTIIIVASSVNNQKFYSPQIITTGCTFDPEPERPMLKFSKIDSADICDAQEWFVPDKKQIAPFALNGLMAEGSAFNQNGFNYVYSGYYELWLSGEFKNGYLWNGEQYIYDAYGNEIRIEIWKRGKHRRDKKSKSIEAIE